MLRIRLLALACVLVLVAPIVSLSGEGQKIRLH